MRNMHIAGLPPQWKNTLRSILEEFYRVKKTSPRKRLISLKTLTSMLTMKQKIVMNDVLSVDPKKFGWKGDYYGEASARHVFLRVKHAVDTSDGCHYLTKPVLHAYVAMNNSMKQSIGKSLYIESGYRSDAYQLIIFMEHLVKNRFDLKRTCRHIALPGWSEHGFPEYQAIDVTTKEAIEGQKIHFEKTNEYAWLTKNAAQFNFYLTYPRKNKLGVTFEPWHWHWQALSSKGNTG